MRHILLLTIFAAGELIFVVNGGCCDTRTEIVLVVTRFFFMNKRLHNKVTALNSMFSIKFTAVFRFDIEQN